jgi:nickel transport system ATP-binding protein
VLLMSRLMIEGLRIETRREGHAVSLVAGLDLQVTEGRVTALVGASGSGKSLSCLGLQDVLPPGVMRTAGRVTVEDGDETRPLRIGRDVATVMQNPRSAFNPVATMRSHAREVFGGARARFEEELMWAVSEVGLDVDRVLDLYAFQMSGGMLQRMMIALALLSGARFLVADEPTTDLDLVVQARVLDLILAQVRGHGLGVLFVTHDMGVVARVADDVVVMEHGRVVERGTVEAIFADPRHSATRALVAAHLALYPEEAVA